MAEPSWPSAPSFIASGAVFALACIGCADGRDPYTAYVDCNQAVARAASASEAIACFGQDPRRIFGFEQADNARWLEEFKSSRPTISSLHEEQLENDPDRSILQMIGSNELGQLVAVSADMRREGRRWKIAAEEVLVRGVAPSAARVSRVSLNIAGDVRWDGGDLVGSIWSKDGRCNVGVEHVYRSPGVRLPVPCALLARPGRHAVDSLQPEFAAAFTVFDQHGLTYSGPSAGFLAITNVEDGFASGAFSLDLQVPSSEITVTGSFQNLAIPRGD